MVKKLPIGESNFRTIIEDQRYYVDKSLLIRDFIETDAKSILVTRPRRWGKSLNFSMLRYFFARVVDGLETKGLFDGLNIAHAVIEDTYNQAVGQTYLEAYQGKSPVIYLSFANMSKGEDFDDIKLSIADIISKCCQQLYKDDQVRQYFEHECDRFLRQDFETLLARKAEKSVLANALETLSRLLYAAYGHKKVYLFLDEYDHPLNHAYGEAYLPLLSEFMKHFLTAGFKTNDYLEKGMMTGVLRVAKASILSGLNSLDVCTVLDDRYAEHFGFTENEVNTLLDCYGLQSKKIEIKQWYNGYQVGETILYNPWSILNAIVENGTLKPYWVNTGGSALISKIILESDHDIQVQLESLLLRTPTNCFSEIDVDVDIYVSFRDLKQGQTTAFWGLLLCSGYITVSKVEPDRLKYKCKIRIPNEEIYALFQDVYKSWLQNTRGSRNYQNLVVSLVQGRIEEFVERLETYLQESASYYDFVRESNYHTFVLGILTGLMDTHYVQSNKESGDGRPDILLIPKDVNNDLGLVLEFKYEADARKFTNNSISLNEQLEKTAAMALDQIESRHYEAGLTPYHHVKTLLKVGIVFYKKQVVARFRS